MDENYQLTRLQVPENKYDDRYIYHFGLCWVFWEGWVYKCEQKNEGQTDKNRLGREEWKGTLRTAQRKKKQWYHSSPGLKRILPPFPSNSSVHVLETMLFLHFFLFADIGRRNSSHAKY